jgi:hypothetical protein
MDVVNLRQKIQKSGLLISLKIVSPESVRGMGSHLRRCLMFCLVYILCAVLVGNAVA